MKQTRGPKYQLDSVPEGNSKEPLSPSSARKDSPQTPLLEPYISYHARLHESSVHLICLVLLVCTSFQQKPHHFQMACVEK